MSERGVTPEDLAARLDMDDDRFSGIEDKLDALIGSVKSLTETVEPIRDDISTIREITTGWRALGTLGAFVKWASGIAAGLLALWALGKAMARGWV